ncbi:Nudc Domain-Containing Protein 2 [Manis pentadactyla]|nr:Nudc Domain-Containing Protein 2 [Manis pentadactyla]
MGRRWMPQSLDWEIYFFLTMRSPETAGAYFVTTAQQNQKRTRGKSKWNFGAKEVKEELRTVATRIINASIHSWTLVKKMKYTSSPHFQEQKQENRILSSQRHNPAPLRPELSAAETVCGQGRMAG